MFLDIGIGILLTFLVGTIFSIEPNLYLFSLGVIFALLPDIDMLLMLLPQDSKLVKLLGSHRGVLHRPFLYVAFTVVFFGLFGKIIGTLFMLGVFYHLLHDTFVLGWGIMWWWPFSRKIYKFFPTIEGKFTNEKIISWLPEEEAGIKSKYGNPNWIRNFYLTINPVSIVEYTVFVLSILLLLGYYTR